MSIRQHIQPGRAARPLLLVFALFVLPACTGRAPAPVEGKKFAALYAAILEQNEAARASRLDSVAAQAAVRHLLDSAGVSPEEVRMTVRAYNADVETWRAFLEEVTKQLEQRSARRSG